MQTDSITKGEAADADDVDKSNDTGQLLMDQNEANETSIESDSPTSNNDNETISDEHVYPEPNNVDRSLRKWAPHPTFSQVHHPGMGNEIDSSTEERSHPQIYPPLNEIDKNTKDWSPSPFTVKKSWNYRSVLNDKMQPRVKISRKNKVNKQKCRKPRINIPHTKHDISSLYVNNVFKKREKSAKGDLLKRRFLQKFRKKIALDCSKEIVNGLPAEKDASVQSERVEVPNESFGGAEEEGQKSENATEEDDVEVAEYAQYLELKPTIKFKCYLCGMNDFSTIALLQEHVSSCTGKVSTSVTPSSPLLTKRALVSTSNASPNLRITRKVFLCSSCGTYYQNYNLYIHMQDKHNKQICLFCRNIFLKPQELWDHLISAHNLTSTKYTNVEQIRNAFKSSFYITCCSCNSIFSNEDRFDQHKCLTDVTTSIEMKDTYCSGCKSKADDVEVPEFRPEPVVEESRPNLLPLLDDVRRDSASSADEYDDAKTSCDEYMSRDSTLDFIGVPEQHTVNSLLEEEGEISRLAVSFCINAGEQAMSKVAEPNVTPELNDVPQQSDSLETNKASVPEVVPPQGSSDEDNKYEMSPLHVNTSEEQKSLISKDENIISPKSEGPVDKLETPASNTNLADDLNTDDEECSPYSVDENVSVASELKPVSPVDSNALVNNVESNWYQETDTKNNNDQQQVSETTPQPLMMALLLDDTVASLSLQTIIKECVKTSCTNCQYCENATIIAVNGSHLAAHLLEEHRYMPTKNEDDCQQVIEKLQTGTIDLSHVYMNATYSSHQEIIFDGTFACLQCSFTTTLYKDLCHHKRRMHHKNIFLCMMCKCNFFFYSQLLCHLCSGVYSTESLLSVTYHCCFCNVDRIPSAFRLMVHLRKVHQACDLCLSRHSDQSELYSHMIKQHKINHLCYKCNLAYRGRDDINKHLFWKHGTESVLCKRCLQKKWPHAYHFCIPASSYTCEECSRVFSKPVALTVHKRAHSGDFPFACEDCDQRLISKKLLALHRRKVHHILPETQDDAIVDNLTAEIEKTTCVEDAKSFNGTHNSDDEEVKKRRKKKRSKKSKVNIEKPLLDELPPLNLSSESEEGSGDEDGAAKNETPRTPLPLPSPPSPSPPVDLPQEPSAEPPAHVTEDDPMEEISKPSESTQTITNNDSIFHSEVTNHSAVSESSDNANKQHSPKPCTKRDKSCCKSITPRKRKRTPRKDSSSSDSSTDSDSSSSSCGSNCSCNKSASNCSSSSSSESTTPEKRNKHKPRSPSKEKQTVVEVAAATTSEFSLLGVPESELETEISTSDEDFYDEQPFVIPPSETKVESPLTTSMPFDTKITISRNSSGKSQTSRDRKSRKRRKKPKITINLGNIQRNNGAATNNSFSQTVSHVETPSFASQLIRGSGYDHWSSDGSANAVASSSNRNTHAGLSVCYTHSANSVGESAGSGDSSGRLPKRKRTKNRFYGYSSSDEGTGNEGLPSIGKKSSNSSKRPPKSRPPFVGIRAKKSLKIIPPKRFATSTPAAPNAVSSHQLMSPYGAYRTPSSVPLSSSSSSVMPRNFVRPVITNSSEDSDSDEKRHTLVINLPRLKEKINNSNTTYRSSTPYSNKNDLYSSHSWISQRSEGNYQSSSSSMGPTQSSKNYCFCQCPYDEVSEMIACDGPGCVIEWFHFECVGIMVPPKGKWFCPNCRKNRENVSRFF